MRKSLRGGFGGGIEGLGFRVQEIPVSGLRFPVYRVAFSVAKWLYEFLGAAGYGAAFPPVKGLYAIGDADGLLALGCH